MASIARSHHEAISAAPMGLEGQRCLGEPIWTGLRLPRALSCSCQRPVAHPPLWSLLGAVNYPGPCCEGHGKRLPLNLIERYYNTDSSCSLPAVV